MKSLWLKQRGRMLRWICIGLLLSPVTHADIAVIVHPGNPVTSLSVEEVRQIFLGRMRLFPATQKNIDPVDQDASLPTRKHFYHIIAKLNPATLERLRAMYLFSGKGLIPKTMPDDASVMDFVAKHPESIGYVKAESVTSKVRRVVLIKE